MKHLVPNIGLADLDLFFRVAKLKSLREASRQLGMTPGAVSKAIRRLEEKADQRLFRRSASGVLLTSEGQELVVIAEKVLSLTAPLNSGAGAKTKAGRIWGIGALSFLSSRLVPQLLEPLARVRPGTRFRLVELSHGRLVAEGLNGAFEMAIHIGALEWTRVWSSHELGMMRWCLFARTGHPLVQVLKVREADAVAYPFVMPTGWSAQGFIRGNDQCPAPWGVRFSGHEATTAETALEILMNSDHLAFVPSILANRSVRAGLLQEICVEDWPPVQRKIYLSVRDDLVSRSLLKMVTELLRKSIQAEMKV